MGGFVSGALNVDTGEFKTWAEYTASEGQNPNEGHYFATGPWQTFRGECMLRPQLTWWEHGPKSFGDWATNISNRRVSKRSTVDVFFAGFTTKTSMPSWRAKCENPNVDAMATLFRTMPGIPHIIIGVWDGLERRRYEERMQVVRSLYLDQGQTGRIVGTTNLRVVRAVQVFRVDAWYWYSNNQDRGFATTWQGIGPGWKYVYADGAFVEGRGLSQMFPTDWPRVGRPLIQRDACVNLENKEVKDLPAGPVSTVSVVSVISRVEL